MRALPVGLLLVGLAVGADRVGEQVAEGVVARQLAGELGTQPAVEVDGFPFLPQAVRGRYERITVDVPSLRRRDLTVRDFRATLTGTRVPLSDVLGRSVDEVPVERLRGSGLVPWATLEDASRGRLSLEPQAGRVRVSGSVPVPGETVEGSTLADVSVEDGDLRLTASQVTVEGEPVTGPAGDALTQALSLRYQVPPLPYDLRLREVEVTRDGVVVGGTATDLVLRP